MNVRPFKVQTPEYRDLDEVDPRPPAFSDDALALRFCDHHEGDLQFVAAWGKWFRWDGACWRQDNTLHAYDLSRDVCRAAAAECHGSDNAKAAIASAKTVAAVERLARADRRIAATTDQWDREPWLLNTPAGVVDLRTAEVHPHRAEDFMTKITAVAPGGECPLFAAFLGRTTGGDLEIISYLQRAFGYALTGLTREHALFFAYGTGANGKSVLLSTIAGILGDYHKTAPIETFVASYGDRHPTDLAGLRGLGLCLRQRQRRGVAGPKAASSS
jgi:putative DNA primase/helicase